MARIVILFLLITLYSHPQINAQTEPSWTGLKWRSIGPYRGGRVTAVAGIATQPNTYYFGATGGGVWKTTDAGVNWEPVSDGYFTTGSVGAIAVSQSDPNVIYVGMGESPIRGNVSHGDGLYKSTDSGKTWKRMGLENTRHIARVRIHPRNPDLVYVAALGHAFGSNPERGIFRSHDGGKSWQKILYRDERSGAIDLVFDPGNPNTLYASLWQVLRTPYSLESGGAGSGIFKSTDGGDNWIEITRNPGLPKGIIGKVGITVSPVNTERVWAIVEAEEGGVFRSENGGRTWVKVNEDRSLRQRAWYYSRIYADTENADIVYVLNVGFHKSNDGGRTFTTIQVPHGDNHDLWIAPNDSQRMIEGNDGGACVTVNGGRTWTELDQPTAQFYRVTTDNDYPYHIYGAQQDNTTVKIVSRSNGFGIDTRGWYSVGGGESGWIAPHPKDSNIVFAGSYGGLLERYDHKTGQIRNISIWPENPMGAGAIDQKYRFQWNFPLRFSPHPPYALYAGSNVVFRSTNEGQSWEAISPDLTRADKSKMGSSGGPITKDNTSVEYYCTIFTLMESPLEKGLIWTGSDDGLVYLTRDEGKSWVNVTPKDMPEWIQINSIEASAHDPATAYIAATMYKSDDFRPYIYKTNDYGKTWSKIVDGIPETAFTRVVREDPHVRGLLYAGTETGVYISFDDGRKWSSLQLNLPVVPITDIAVHRRDRDLIVATQGRSFWILDDLAVIEQWKEQLEDSELFVYKPEPAYRTVGFRGVYSPRSTVGQNPPSGAVIYYKLKSKPTSEVKIEILDGSGALLRSFSSKDEEIDNRRGGNEEAMPGQVTASAGLNRFIWDLRYPEATRFPGMILWSGNTQGPKVVPGEYQVRVSVDGKSQTEKFEVRADPRVETSTEDYQKQLALRLKIHTKLTETNDAVVQIRDIRKQIEEVSAKLQNMPEGRDALELARLLKERLTAIEEALYQTKNQSSQDPLNYPIRLNDKLAGLARVVDSADAAPTEQAYQVFEDLSNRIDTQLDSLKKILSTDVVEFNRLVREISPPAIKLKTSK